MKPVGSCRPARPVRRSWPWSKPAPGAPAAMRCWPGSNWPPFLHRRCRSWRPACAATRPACGAMPGVVRPCAGIQTCRPLCSRSTRCARTCRVVPASVSGWRPSALRCKPAACGTACWPTAPVCWSCRPCACVPPRVRRQRWRAWAMHRGRRRPWTWPTSVTGCRPAWRGAISRRLIRTRKSWSSCP